MSILKSLLHVSFASLAAVSLLAQPLLAAGTKVAKAPSTKKAAIEHVTIIPLTNMLINGKKVWLPGEVKARHGKVKFVLNNTLAEPHGFQIPGVMSTGVVVPAKQTLEVPVTLAKKQKYELKCHMHPTHVSAQIETY